MLLLFFRPRVCAVWPNYEVVVFEPNSGTDPNLGSVANVTSKLKPAPLLSTVFWIFIYPSPYVFLPPPLSATFGLSYTSVLHYIILLLFRSWISCPPVQTSTPISPQHPSLRSLSSHPLHAPQHTSLPLKPRATCLFLPPLSLSICSPFVALNVSSIPVDPCGCYFLGSVLPPPLTQTTPLLFKPLPEARSLPILRRFLFQVSFLLSSCTLCSLLTRSCADPSLGVFWWFVIVIGFLLHANKRPGRLHSLAISHPIPHHWATWPFRRTSPPPRPLPSPPCPFDPIPVSWYWRGAALERNRTVCCHCRGCLACKTRVLIN